jgi:CRISPR-associated protein Cas1
MQERIIDLSETPAALSVRYDQLVIKREEGEFPTPLAELAVLIVANRAVNYTHSVLVGICENGAALLICNEKKMPAGMIIPYAGHFMQTPRFAAQIKAGRATQKRLWQQITKAKISGQAAHLKETKGDDWGLTRLARQVTSGDSFNAEAQASRRYWSALFAGNFRRIPESGDAANSMLNYGYAVLRSLVARAICASGLHPSIGIHHHNQYDQFCLADDLMEPFRPTVDRAVVNTLVFYGHDTALDRGSKSLLLDEIFKSRFIINKESRDIFDAIRQMTSSLADVFIQKKKKIILPET